MNIIQRLANLWKRGLQFLATVSVRVDDSNSNKGWNLLNGGPGPVDRDWSETLQDLTDALEAWRNNFFIRQVVRLTTAYVVGDGVQVTSRNKTVDTFVQEFWSHPENKLDTRLSSWCDELTRSGELFPVLFTNKVNGMSQIRIVPASSIMDIETDPNDYEKELAYKESIAGQVEPRPWKSKRTARVFRPRDDNRQRKPDPVMLHYAINKPVGAVRGEGDLTHLLPWAKRYTEWLKDRVRFNRLRTDLAAVDIEVSDDSQVENKKQQYRANPPTGGAITVHGPGEKISYPAANIQGFEAEPDGRAIRLAFAAGANRPLHFFAEGSSATRSTAAEMGDPTHRDFRMRQKDFAGFLVDLCEQAWRRHEQVLGLTPLDDLELEAVLPDVSRADNTALAGAAKSIVETLAIMRDRGWVTDELAVELAFRFAGELLTQEEIGEILSDGEGSEEPEQGEDQGSIEQGSLQFLPANGYRANGDYVE